MVREQMPRFPIRTRLLFLFTLQVALIFGVGGFYLDWQLRNTLEKELSSKLAGLANAAALQLDTDLLINLTRGDESTRTYRNLKSRLQDFTERTAVRRIYVFDRHRRRVLDSKEGTLIGDEYRFLPITDAEVAAVFSGGTAASVLFKGSDGRRYKTSFVPVMQGKAVVAGLAVEASAHTLESVSAVRRVLLAAGVFVLVSSIALGFLFSERITTPINRLKTAAERIKHGDYQSAIHPAGKDEVGFLGQTMEEMRHAIVHRDTRQKAMLAGVAHEIRNPLGGIELFAGLLVQELQGQDASLQAQKIAKEVQNLKQIVSDFLDYARPRKARKEMVDIAGIFAEARTLLADELARHDVQFEAPAHEVSIQVDPNHLRQIFLNLMRNSTQAMSLPGRMRLKVESRQDACLLFFWDSGPGIAASLAERVFEPFFTGRRDGTGLGLAIVRSLVEENDGQITLEPGQQKGALFRLTFQCHRTGAQLETKG